MIKLIAALLGVIALTSVYSAHRWWNNMPVPKVSAAPADEVTARLHSLEQTLVAVQQSLQSEQDSTLALQREVFALREKLDLQVQASAGLAGEADSGNKVATELEQSPSLSGNAVDDAVVREQADAAHSRSDWYQQWSNPLEPSAANLEASGVDPDTAKDIQRRLDEYTLAELEVRDTAAREGWLQSDDYEARQQALLPPEVDLKAELGEQGWDRFLYLQGRNNRVRVESVINGSAAASAGIEAGDLLLVYADEKIFTVSELQAATREGQRGEVVTVRLQRLGAVLDTTIERGPLGVMLGAERVSPEQATLNP